MLMQIISNFFQRPCKLYATIIFQILVPVEKAAGSVMLVLVVAEVVIDPDDEDNISP